MYRMLSFDGGGLRGLVTIGIMRRIGSALQDPLWYRKADLYAGTSTGGIIALGLAAGIPLSDVETLYREHGSRIFNRTSWWYASSLRRTLHCGYRNTALRSRLGRLFGEKRLEELEKAVVIPAFLLDDAGTNGFPTHSQPHWKPKIFHNLAGGDQDHGLCRDIALYTSSAPTYLPSAGSYIDGGVFANNPAMCAVAQMLDPRNADVLETRNLTMLSMGSGLVPGRITGQNLTWGILRWAPKLLTVLFDGNEGVVDYQCRQILGRTHYQRIQLQLDKRTSLDNARAIPRMNTLVNQVSDDQVESWAAWIDRYWLKQ